MTKIACPASMLQLRKWHRKLSAAHRHAVMVENEAVAAFGDDSNDAIIIRDPTIELHAALGRIESLIDERTHPTDRSEP